MTDLHHSGRKSTRAEKTDSFYDPKVKESSNRNEDSMQSLQCMQNSWYSSNRSMRKQKVSGQKSYLPIPQMPSQKAPGLYFHRVLSWRFGSENWLCHSCHFNPQWSIVKEHGGVNCPHSVPANQREYIATQIHAAYIHYLCPGGKPCPNFFIKKRIYPSFWPCCVKILFCIMFHRSKPCGANQIRFLFILLVNIKYSRFIPSLILTAVCLLSEEFCGEVLGKRLSRREVICFPLL